jgi:hypothetical protein
MRLVAAQGKSLSDRRKPNASSIDALADTIRHKPFLDLTTKKKPVY